jgi:predicted membrane protein
VATIFYSVLAVYSLGSDAFSIIAIVLGWGLACVLRWVQLQLLIGDQIDRRQTQRVHEHLRQIREEGS